MKHAKQLIAFTAALLCSGCGGDGIDRVAVSGNVTLNGDPLTTGSIRFQPLSAGPSAGGSIEAGTFDIPTAEGPGLGEYRVEIVSFQPTGRQVPDPDLPGQTKEELKQVVARRYNRESELTVTCIATAPNQFDFALTSELQDAEK